MNFVDMVLETLKQSKQKFWTQDQILKMTGAQVGFDKRAVLGAIDELIKQDKLVRSARNKFTLPINAGAIRGKVMATSRGYVFVRPDAKEVDDIFIAKKNTNGAVHGDTVLVRIETPKKRKNGRFGHQSQSKSGEIIKIIEHNIKNITGVFTLNAGGNIVVPDDTRFADSIFIPMGKTLGAKTNDKVVVKITDYPSRISMAKGEVVEILGDAGDVKVATLSILRNYGLYETFPASVLAEAKAVAKITASDLKGRTDFRNQLVITIDGADAKDFDDAISLKEIAGGYELSVHIADVSHYVKEGGEIDKEAFKRGTSVYFPDLVLPMLPESLSNFICSLQPNVERLTLSCVMTLDDKANVTGFKITKGIIKSAFRMTYDQVTKIFAGDKVEREKCKIVVPMLENMRKVSKMLIKRRNLAGNIDFDLPETQIDVDENGKTINIRKKPRNDSDKLIEQFMVLANEMVAKTFNKMKLPFVYRVHESPTPEKLKAFCEFAWGLGLKFENDPENVKPKDFQKLLIETQKEPFHDALSKVMLRSMQKAVYYEKNLGHFGLALKDYCHFTSPIRRYPDLTIHRIISYYLAGQLSDAKIDALWDTVAEASEQSSITERNADEAERTVDDQKKAEFMADKIGEIYDAKISGVTESGIFVELENTVEGLVYLEYLPADSYIYDEKHMALAGKRNIFKIGDKVRVRLIQVDVVTRHIDFALADDNAVGAGNGDLTRFLGNGVRVNDASNENKNKKRGENNKNCKKHTKSKAGRGRGRKETAK